MGYLPNPAAPESYHELVLWRKILDRNPLFVTLTDKLAAKAHISSACPELALPRTLWSGRDAIDIPSRPAGRRCRRQDQPTARDEHLRRRWRPRRRLHRRQSEALA
jgi:hypothetical protein